MFSLKTPAFIIGSRQIGPLVNYIVSKTQISKTQISIASREKNITQGWGWLLPGKFWPGHLLTLSRCLTVSLSLDFSHPLSVLLGLRFSPFTFLLSCKKLIHFSSHTFLPADAKVKMTPACFSRKHVFPQNSVVHYPPVGPQKNFPKRGDGSSPWKKFLQLLLLMCHDMMTDV